MEMPMAVEITDNTADVIFKFGHNLDTLEKRRGDSASSASLENRGIPRSLRTC